MIEQLKKAGDIAWSGICGGLAVNSVFSLCTLPDRIIEEVDKLAKGHISTESLLNLAFTAYGVYSIKKTVKSLVQGGTANTLSVITGIFSALVAGSWGNEKAWWGGMIGAAVTGLTYAMIKAKQPTRLSRGEFIRNQLQNNLAR